MAGYAELIVDKGTDFNAIITISDDITGDTLNVSGYTFSSQIRKSPYSANATASMVCVINNAATGNVSLTMGANVTSNINPGRYMFDMKMTNTFGTVTRVVEGIITITPSITA